MKTLSLIAVFLVGPQAWAGCEELAGKYRGVADASYTSDFSRLEIGITDKGAGAKVALWPEGSPEPRRFDLALDAQEHPGDGSYTGESYVAFCENEEITVRAKFAERAEPLIYLFYAAEGEIRLVNALGAFSRLTGRFTAL